MNEKELFGGDPLLIRYRGPFDYDGLMNVIRSYYPKVKMDGHRESKFKHKASGGGAEVEFKMEGDRKVTHIIKVILAIEGEITYGKLTEKVINGKTQKLNDDGKVEIRISSKVIYDFAKKFPDKPKGWVEKIEKKMVDGVMGPGGLVYGENKVAGESFAKKLAKNLHLEIKKHLNMVCV